MFLLLARTDKDKFQSSISRFKLGPNHALVYFCVEKSNTKTGHPADSVKVNVKHKYTKSIKYLVDAISKSIVRCQSSGF